MIYAKNGIWHPQLFDTNKLNLYQQIIKKDSINFKLSDIIKHSKIHYCIFQNQLIFTLSTPSVREEEFEIYKIHALLINHNLPGNPKPSIFAKTEIKYIAVTINKQNYFLEDDSFFKSCDRIQLKLICNNLPTLLDVNKNSNCESSLFKKLFRVSCTRACILSKPNRTQSQGNYINCPPNSSYAGFILIL